MPFTYIIIRVFDPLVAFVAIVVGASFGVYTFLHLLLVEGKPSLAFSMQHWSDANSARLQRYLGPISYREGLPDIPYTVGQADRIVIDVGLVFYLSILIQRSH